MYFRRKDIINISVDVNNTKMEIIVPLWHHRFCSEYKSVHRQLLMFQFFLNGGCAFFSGNIADQHQAEKYQGSSAPPGQWGGFSKYDVAYERLREGYL